MAESTVIIVGAGPSGLATAACLNLHSIPNIVLEREDCPASIFNKKSYDRLKLHLVKQVCELPHMSFPSSYPTYVPKKEYVQYLDDYVKHFKINPIYHRNVESASFDEDEYRWKIVARNVGSGEMEEYFGRFLVVATGENSDEFIPEVEGLKSFKGDIIHSTLYKNGKKYEGNSVLVVGCGNSGMEIALDLSNYGAKTSLVVRNPLHILSRWMVHLGVTLVKYFPSSIVESFIVLLSKLRYGDLTKYGIERPKDGPFTIKMKYGKDPVLDVGTCNKIKSGQIQILPAITKITSGEAIFKNGKSHQFDAIVFATGFKRSTKKWLKGDNYLLNEDGMVKQNFPNHWKGEKGLYCAGLAGRGLFGAALDAQMIADDIKLLL